MTFYNILSDFLAYLLPLFLLLLLLFLLFFLLLLLLQTISTLLIMPPLCGNDMVLTLYPYMRSLT